MSATTPMRDAITPHPRVTAVGANRSESGPKMLFVTRTGSVCASRAAACIREVNSSGVSRKSAAADRTVNVPPPNPATTAKSEASQN